MASMLVIYLVRVINESGQVKVSSYTRVAFTHRFLYLLKGDVWSPTRRPRVDNHHEPDRTSLATFQAASFYTSSMVRPFE